MDKDIYEKIIDKKEFSHLLKKDVELVFNKFNKRQVSDEEKIRLTRDLLRKVFSVFSSKKVLNKNILDKKSFEEILKKHLSTRERFDFYEELYKRLLEKDDEIVIDLGAGINGLSYEYFNKKIKYAAIEAVGQLVDLMNEFFRKNSIKNANVIQESLFELRNIKKLIEKQKGKKVVFLFKTLDSLEMVERDFSKKLLEEIVPLVDRVVVSFATRSLVSKKSFRVKRYWFENFVKQNFRVISDFELGGERYFVFSKKYS